MPDVPMKTYFCWVMRKKKNTLSDPDLRDFLVFSLQSRMLNYQVAFYLNRYLDWKLVREENLQVKIEPSAEHLEFAFFRYQPDNYREISLLSQINTNEPLIRDYYIIIKGFFSQEEQQRLVDLPSVDPEILSVNPIQLPETTPRKKITSKSLEMLYYVCLDLEQHLINLEKKKRDIKRYDPEQR